MSRSVPDDDKTDPGRVPRTLKLRRSVPLRFTAATLASGMVLLDAVLLPHIGQRISPEVMNLLLLLWGAFVAGDTWRPTGTLRHPTAAP